MLTSTVPCGDGGLDESPSVPPVGVVGLLDAAPVRDGRSAGGMPGGGLPCSGDPDLWFAETPGELERAKKLCGSCPVREECLAGALARREPWGVWGGEIFERGAVVARKRPRGRPRKHDPARMERTRAA
jgi:WhiB family redox-sensing transcriptional regulator